ncbi:MAG: hypothetical protein IKU25_01690 [Clostridia bacterium]|nr:hypothetical protein [Clostridia bacterium]
MTEKLIFAVPTVPDVVLRLDKKLLTFHGEYVGRSVLSAKMIAQIGFDVCENVRAGIKDGIEECFKKMTGFELSQERLTTSKYAAVETKVFGIINENTALYSFGVLLRDLLISSGHCDLRLRAILDKTCNKYPFNRHQSFRELQEDFALYLKNNVDEETYGVIITASPCLAAHTSTEKASPLQDEPVHFQCYSRSQNVKHSLLKFLTFERVQIMVAAVLILFSSISIPLTSTNKNPGLPTMVQTQNEK